MKCFHSILVIAVLASGVASEEANPLGKVVSLLDSLAAKITQEGEAETKDYQAYVDWCDDTSKNTGFEIKTATSAKETLEATIVKLTSDIETASAKIDDLAASIAKDDADLQSATTIRDKEAAGFAANEAELKDVVETLSNAIRILSREAAKNPAAFAQVDTASFNNVLSALSAVVDAAAFSNADKTKLLGLVQSQSGSDDGDEEFGAPAVAAYKTHSTSILDVLDDLKDKAEEQLSDLRKAEANTRHNYEMLKQSLQDQIAADTKDLGDEKSARSGAEEAKAGAEGDHAVTSKDLADGKGALATAHANCAQTTQDHQATVAARAEELKAIAQAKNILTSSTAGAVGQTYSLLQLRAARSRSTLQTHADLAGIEVVGMVKRLAKKQHSGALAQLASRMNAILRYGGSGGEDPFEKVRGLISDMIGKLESQAGAEATEKAYCDEQIAKTEQKKTELQYDISKLNSKLDMAGAKSAGLKQDVKELQSELAELAKLQAEMDNIRRQSHADFVQAKSDLEQGLEGVRKAKSVLQEYYGSASALVQQPAAPALHEKATGAGTGIIGLLEVVESDFAKNLAIESTEEEDAETEYKTTSQVNKWTKTSKDQDVKYKTQEATSLDKSIAELSADRETTDAELSAVLEYDSKIKDRCISKAESYAERSRRREAEIDGLKEALRVLEDDTAFVQGGKKGSLRAHF